MGCVRVGRRVSGRFVGGGGLGVVYIWSLPVGRRWATVSVVVRAGWRAGGVMGGLRDEVVEHARRYVSRDTCAGCVELSRIGVLAVPGR